MQRRGWIKKPLSRQGPWNQVEDEPTPGLLVRVLDGRWGSCQVSR